MLGPYGETLVLDWGLAKWFAGDESADEAGGHAPSSSPSPGDLTAAGAVLGTPRYMSPEQAKGKPVGPPSDIYALGLLLYAILTGKPAYDEASLPDADPRRSVEDPQVVPPRIRDPRLPRALEAICLKTLSARPEDRYASARGLAEDVANWLADEPVSAWHEPVSLRTRRWMKRHRTWVASTAAVTVFALAGLAVFATVLDGKNRELTASNNDLDRQRQVAMHEESKAKESEAESRMVLDFFQKNVLAAARPKDLEGGLGIEATIRDAMDAAEPSIGKSFADQPVVEASIRDTLGQSYGHLGEPALAIRQHERAVELRRRFLGLDSPDTLISENYLASAYQAAGRLDDALALFKQVLKVRQAKLGLDDPYTLSSMHNLATAYQHQGRLDEAVSLHEETLRRTEATLGPDNPDTFHSMNNLAAAYQSAGRLADALPLFEETLKRRQATLGPDNPFTLISMGSLAGAYQSADRLVDALPRFEVALKRMQATLGPDNPHTLTAMNNLALAYRGARRFGDALPLFEQTLKQRRTKLPPNHPDTLTAMNNLALAYWEGGRPADAAPLFEETLKQRRATLVPDHPDTLISMGNLASVYRGAGRLDDSLSLFKEALERSKLKLAPDHPQTLQLMNNTASAYRAAGRPADAIPLFEEAIKGLQAKLGPDNPYTLATMDNLALAYQADNRLAKSVPLFEEVLQRRRARFGPDNPSTLSTMDNLGRVYLAEKPIQAESIFREALVIREKKVPDEWLTSYTRSMLGASLLGQKRYAEAEKNLLRGYAGMKARELRTSVPEWFRFRQESVAHHPPLRGVEQARRGGGVEDQTGDARPARRRLRQTLSGNSAFGAADASVSVGRPPRTLAHGQAVPADQDSDTVGQ